MSGDGRFGRLGGGSFHGSNRFQMSAMDLQTGARRQASRGPTAGPTGPTGGPTGGPSAAAQYGDHSALSARNLLIRHKLAERKHFDSADYAMESNKRQKEDAASATASSAQATAQVGASALRSALQDASPSASPAASPSPPAGRYGALAQGGAASARSILLSKKLRDKKHFDSADYQLARHQASSPSSSSDTQPGLFVGTADDGGSPMDVDDEADAINSPSAARVGAAATLSSGTRRLAQMSPSVRGGGSFGSPCRRAGPVEDAPRFFVPADSSSSSSSTSGGGGGGGGASKYGKLSAAHVLIRRQLRERKRFDSADYAMEQQSGEADASPADEAECEDGGGSAGALLGGHVVMSVPAARHEHASAPDALPAFLAREDAAPSSISHQVKHIKLSEGGSRPTMSQDSRLAARSVILQRKLAERKRFDSADYYKARSTSSG